MANPEPICVTLDPVKNGWHAYAWAPSRLDFTVLGWGPDVTAAIEKAVELTEIHRRIDWRIAREALP